MTNIFESTVSASQSTYPIARSPAAGEPSRMLNERIAHAFNPAPFLGNDAIVNASLEEMLYEALAQFKIHISTVAMHLSKGERDRLFGQLDDLLDIEEWDDRDPAPSLMSFRTFLRLLLKRRPVLRPSVGASNSGNLVAAWLNEHGRLTIECLPNDVSRWSLIYNTSAGQEKMGGETSVSTMMHSIDPYGFTIMGMASA